eukprot:CAMPEP_0197193912 /NCGR_PEP_ID=MMETSP1423-20130617/28243_1 /TAXON_ID=476441 /ORGANISM="Pseudo-nitzschia heimii, Strain UNC1101" /LENGTH=90 /DNA_ID=CAMNT_0042647239 /DNA_START=185 /DNA_END=454 /DNA_ORIENTATION=-
MRMVPLDVGPIRDTGMCLGQGFYGHENTWRAANQSSCRLRRRGCSRGPTGPGWQRRCHGILPAHQTAEDVTGIKMVVRPLEHPILAPERR